MGKIIGYFFIILLACFILFFWLGLSLFSGDVIMTFGLILIVLLSFLISLLIYLIELLKEKL
jgi:hypothetical protein